MVLHYLIVTATVIGFVVMFSWIVMIAWLISTVIGESRFNRLLKQRAERDFDKVRYSWLREMKECPYESAAGDSRFTANEHHINFQFDNNEDRFDTVVTGMVFDIQERYPNEFA